MSKLSDKQRAWVKKFGAVVNSGNGGGPEVAAPPEKLNIITVSATATRQPQPAGAAPGKVALGARENAVGGILPVPIPDAGNRTCICMIINNTDQTLILDPVSATEVSDADSIGLAHGEYKSKPPARINPQQKDAKFRAVNKSVPILDIHTAGVEGRVRYFLDDQKKSAWKLHFDNPALKTHGNSGDAELEGPKDLTAKFDAPDPDFDEGNEVTFTFTLNPVGGPGPKPKPGPQPDPQDVKASCLITVTNNTKLPLTLADQGHDRGDFVSFPPQTIPPGGSNQFVSTQTPRGKDTGCKGFVSWEVGSPSAAIWRCEWDNVVGDKNTAKAPAEPQSAGFRTLAQIGEGDENVPVAFTISGGGDGPGPGPGPKPEPKPDPEPSFDAPPGSRQPTLRKGDKSPDGWVEYLQTLLNAHLGKGTVDIDGSFGAKTYAAVIKFQQQKKLQVDGTVGNQTWAALRLEKAEAPSTDGRQPHTFEQKDLQARWEVNDTPDALYRTDKDRLEINVVNVGEGKIDDFSATVRVTPPGTASKTVKVKIGPPFKRQKDDQGNLHAVNLENFKKNFPAKDPNAKMEDYLIEAFFDKELGPDLFKGHILVQ
jgi:hypothetical protein